MQTGKVGKSESAPVCLHTLSPHNMTPTNEIYCCDLFPWQPAARTSVYLKKTNGGTPKASHWSNGDADSGWLSLSANHKGTLSIRLCLRVNILASAW